MTSYFPEKNDLPGDYGTRLQEMKRQDKTWHFNPKLEDKESIKTKKSLQISEEDQKEILSYSQSLPIEIGASIYQGEMTSYKENDLVWRKLDHIHHGYTKENTVMRYKRTSYQESPSFLKEIFMKSNLRIASAGVIRLHPGITIPWHYDSHIFYSEKQQSRTEQSGEAYNFPV